MTKEELRKWQMFMGFTDEKAFNALGMSSTGYKKMLYGQSKIDLRTALACAAIYEGLEPWPEKFAKEPYLYAPAFEGGPVPRI
jgi:hypothetical protein